MTILNLENISLHFPGSIKPALRGIDYAMQQGDFVILLGSNGSGKSTLLKLLHRDLQPATGQIHLFNQPIMRYSTKDFSPHVAVLTQNCSDSLFTSLTVYENFLMVNQQSSGMTRPFIEQYLFDYNPHLADKLDASIEQLSGGEKQALALALCFLRPPSLLLLDEHTSALDPKSSDQIMRLTEKMVRQHHITCIVTTHDLDIAMQYGNRLLVLREGKIHKTIDSEGKLALSKEVLMKMYY